MKIAPNYSFLSKCHVSALQHFFGLDVSHLEGTWEAPADGVVGAMLWVTGKGEGPAS